MENILSQEERDGTAMQHVYPASVFNGSTIKSEGSWIRRTALPTTRKPSSVMDIDFFEEKPIPNNIMCFENNPSTLQNEPSTSQNEPSTSQNKPSTLQNEPSTLQNELSAIQNELSAIQIEFSAIQNDGVSGMGTTRKV